MRLLVVTQYFWPENFRINDLVIELVQRGHQVTVLTGYPNYPEGSIYPEFRNNPKRFEEFHGATVIRVPLVSRNKGSWRLVLNYLSFAMNASVIGAWKLRGEKYDAIFAYEPSPITVGIPAIVQRALKRAPLAFWVLDLWPETLQAIGAVRSKMVLHVIGKLVSLIYKRCDLILAQSKSFIPQIAKYGIDGSRIVYFPSWAESVFDSGDVSKAWEVPEREGSFNVMFAGNIGDAQDFPAIIIAAEKLKTYSQIRWLIVGEGRMSDWVKAEISRLDLGRCVFMLGRYPLERMPSFYRHADALLVSLKDEAIFSMTIPGKLQSYLAAGIPIIAMLNGEGADIIEQSHAGIRCSAGSGEELAVAVLKMASLSNEQRAEMGKNGLILTEREFHRAKLIDRLENWLERLSRRLQG